MTLLIKEEEVLRAVTPMDIIQAVEDGFRQHGLGLAQTKARREVRIRNKNLPHADPRMVRVGQGLAFLEESGVVLVNLILSFPDRRKPGTRFLNYVIDANDGTVIAVVESSTLTALRTAASGAVGAKYLARKNSMIAGIIGTGRQGRHQLRFLSKVIHISKAYCYSLVPEETLAYCHEMGKELGITILPSKNVEEVVRISDILVTATQSTTPIIKTDWLRHGQHFNIIGADDAPKIELEGAALKKADKLVISARDCLLTGQLRIPIDEGIITEANIYGTIGEIVAGKKHGRESEREITIFHSPGITIQDAAAAYKVYQKAHELGLGKEVVDPFALE